MQTYPPGTRIGQYEIASRPMMGGMGVVYFALDHGNDGRPVALKTFRPELLPDRAARDRFLREGTAWVELGNHSHIVRCYRVEYIDPTAFLVLELIAKEQNMPDASLRSWLILGHPLPIEQALLFALQIARGMQHATEKIPGFVHRDLKPENILVGADRLPNTNINRLRVTDFGLVKTIADSVAPATINKAEELKPNQIQFTRGVGTPLYMAPEQWKGEPVGVFTDVYAFGCILYEMLTGNRAAEGKTITELQASHCNGKLRPIPSSLPKDLVVLVAKCLALNPENRFCAWNEIAIELEHIYTEQSGQLPSKVVEPSNMNHNDLVQSGWSYNTIGISYKDIGEADVAQSYFERVMGIGKVERERALEAAGLDGLGLVSARLGDVRQAIRYYDQTLTIYLDLGDQSGEGGALGRLGMAYSELGDFQRAMDYYEQGLAIARQLGNRRGEGNALGNMGSAYMNWGETQLSKEYYEQALAIHSEIGDSRGEAGDWCGLGLAYAAFGDARESIKYYQWALNTDHEIGDRREEGNTLSNLGNAYYQLSNLPQAIEVHRQALAIRHEIGDRRGEGNDLNNLGCSYATLGDLDQASRFFEQALALRREIGDINGVATTLMNIAELHYQGGESDLALSSAQQAAEIFTQIGHTENAERVQHLITQLQSGRASEPSQNLAEQAFEAFQRTQSPADMRGVVEEFPFMINERFLSAIQHAIVGASTETRPALEQRLNSLRQIANERQY